MGDIGKPGPVPSMQKLCYLLNMMGSYLEVCSAEERLNVCQRIDRVLGA
jgi:hypothetical protein